MGAAAIAAGVGAVAAGLGAAGVIGGTTAGLIGTAATIGGTLLSSGGAKSAANAQAQSAKDALALQKAEFEQQQKNIAPWLEAGGNALTKLSDVLGITNGQGFQETPGYQFAFNEGQRAINSTMNAKGLYGSGARAKALTEFGTGIANQEYGNWLNRLASVAGLGQTAVGQGITAGTNYANQSSQLLEDAGTARASGYAANANIWGSAIPGITNNLSTLISSAFKPSLSSVVNQSITNNPLLF